MKVISLRKKNHTDVTNRIDVTKSVNFKKYCSELQLQSYNLLKILLSWSDKVQFGSVVVILLLEGAMNHLQDGEMMLSAWMWMLTGLK